LRLNDVKYKGAYVKGGKKINYLRAKK